MHYNHLVYCDETNIQHFVFILQTILNYIFRMTLKEYRTKHLLTVRDMAQLCGISSAVLCMLETGKRKPTFAHILIIEKATKRKVRFGDFETQQHKEAK